MHGSLVNAYPTPHAIIGTDEWAVDRVLEVSESHSELVNRCSQPCAVHKQCQKHYRPIEGSYISLSLVAELHVPIQVEPHGHG